MRRSAQKIVDGLNDAIAISRGEADPATYRVHRVSKAEFDQIVATCENPPPPSEGLKRLMREAGQAKIPSSLSARGG